MARKLTTAAIVAERRRALQSIRNQEIKTDSALEKLERFLLQLIRRKNTILSGDEMGRVLDFAKAADAEMNLLVNQISSGISMFKTVI